MKGLTQAQVDARMEAYGQAIRSLSGNWTDEDDEREQGNLLIDILTNQSERWFAKQFERLNLSGMTAQEADAAYDAAPSIPISQEEIESIVQKVKEMDTD